MTETDNYRRVYHITSLESATKALAQRKLKLSRIGDLNDPFEWLSLDPPERKHREALRHVRKDFDASVGLICFSRHWRNPVLWSHYGAKHRGVALGFDIPNEFAIDVEYVSERIACRPSSEGKWPRDLVAKLHCTKFEHWSYEEETRLVFSLDEAEELDGAHFISFGPQLRLREIVVGPECHLESTWIQEVAGGRRLSAELIWSRLALHSYAVVRNKLKKSRLV